MTNPSAKYFCSLHEGQDEDQLVLFYKQKLLSRGGKILWPRGTLPPLPETSGQHLLVDVIDSQRIIAINLEIDLSSDLMAEPLSLRQILLEYGRNDFRIAGLSSQLVNWYQTHRYCGACGRPTSPHAVERALTCEPCGLSFYPRINPCVIVLVTDGDRALLARNARYTNKFYSCLAGFMEAGETPEDTVAREVREEVGIEVTNIRYFKSQSWPFPSQLMLGFYADYAGGEVVVDAEEIDDARWFRREDLPNTPIPAISVAGELIANFFALQEA